MFPVPKINVWLLAAMYLLLTEGSAFALSCPVATLEVAVSKSKSAFEGILLNFQALQTFEHHATARATFRVVKVLKVTSPSMPVDILYDDSMAYFSGIKRTPEMPEQELKSGPLIYFVGQGQQGQPEIRFGGCDFNGIAPTETARLSIEQLAKQ